MEQITLFQHANYAGIKQSLSIGRYDVAANTLKENDSFSSVKVPSGLVVRLYEHGWFQGRYLDIAMDTPALPMFWNDRISSVIVQAVKDKQPIIEEAIVFTDGGYQGDHQTLKPGRFDRSIGNLKIKDKSISSVLVPRGLVVRLYQNADYTGAFVDLAGDVEYISQEWNDKASSVEVLLAPPGLAGQSTLNAGLLGESSESNGVRGISHAEGNGAVVGVNDNNSNKAGPGVFGQSDGSGVWGESRTWMGVYGHSRSTTGGAGVFGEGDGAAGIGIFGRGKKLAGYFQGDVEVTGDIRLTNADCAEDFDIAGLTACEPGTVMVLGEEGGLTPSCHAYDKRVAGVVSGAGDYKPGIVLDKKQSDTNRQPIALLGKVFCKVDATHGAIEVGDLLTTSDSVGHAMKTDDPLKAFGSVIGKALRPLKQGRGLIPILIARQ